MSYIKIHELLLDLPDVKKETLFYLTKERSYYITQRNYDYLVSHPEYDGLYYADDPTYHMDLVENNSTWFKKIVTEPKIEINSLQDGSESPLIAF